MTVPQSVLNSDPDQVRWADLKKYLLSLKPSVREAVYLAAVPLWFNADLFATLWDGAHKQPVGLGTWRRQMTRLFERISKPAEAPTSPLKEMAENQSSQHTLYITLRHTPLIESAPQGMFRLKAAERRLILQNVWAANLPRFQQLNQLLWQVARQQDQTADRWHTAVLYYRLLANPSQETDRFKVALLNGFQQEQWDWIARLLPALHTAVKASCLRGRAVAWVYCGQAWLHAEKRNLNQARVAYQNALEAPQADLLVQAGCTLALAELYLPPYDGRVAEAEQLVRTAQSRYRQMGNWYGYANCYHILADIARLKGDTQTAHKAYSHAAQTYRRVGARTQAAHCLHDAALLHVEMDDPEAAETQFAAARHVYYRTGRWTPWLGPLLERAHYLKDEALSAFHLGKYQQAQDKIFAALVLYDTQQVQTEQPLWSKGRAFELLGQIEQKRFEWREAARWYREASAQYRLGDFTSDLARLLSRQAEIARAEENSTRAIAQLEQAAKLQRKLGQFDEEARYHLQAAETAESNYDDERALTLLNEARRRFVMSGNRLHLVECDWRLGQFYERTDAPHTAEHWYELAQSEAEQIGDLLGQGHAHRKLGWLACQQYDVVTARHHYDLAATCYQHLPDWPGLGYVMLGQGWLASLAGQRDTAVHWWQEAYRIAREHDVTRLHSCVLLAQAKVALDAAMLTTARRALREAETVAQAEHDQWQLATVYRLWARLARQLGQFDKAQTHLHWGWEAAEMAHVPLAQAEILLEQARLAQTQDDMDTAVNWLARAHAQFDHIELDRGAMACRVLGAKLAWQRGELAVAVGQMQQALDYYDTIEYRPASQRLRRWLATHQPRQDTAVALL